MNGTKPPKNVPTTGINCDKIPAATPKAIGDGKPINKNETDKTILAKTPNITFATIKPPALETPILHTWSIEVDMLLGSDSFNLILQLD